MIKLHKWKLLSLALLANLALIASLATGEPKNIAAWNWLDIVSEGGAALLALSWLLLILHSRPAGRVTQLLSMGLSAIVLAGFQDCLDEFFAFPDTAVWDHWIESGFMPVGLVLITLGIYHWHKEQIIISAQLQKRERLFREHRGLDFITSLSGANYLRAQLNHELDNKKETEPLALVLIDIDNFAHINRQYGHHEGDQLLHALSELLLLNIRRNDLLCRYAGDRFALVLPNTGKLMTDTIALEITQAVRHFAFKSKTHNESLFHSVSIGTAFANNSDAVDTAETLIARATQSLLHAKAQRSLVLSQVA